MKKYTTHRCNQLLNHNKENSWQVVTIRKINNPNMIDIQLHYDKWTFGYLETDSEDWDNQFIRDIAEVKICPYCGMILGEKE